MQEIKVKITFTEEVLGTLPADEEIYSKFIASNAPDAATREQEIETMGVEEYTEKALTIFPKYEDGQPFIYDYQIRGFFKEMCGIIKQIDGTESSKIIAHKKLIDNFIFVEPRKISLNLNGGEIGVCQRPLRASTPQGERVALAMSETAPVGTTAEFTVILTTQGKKGKKGKEDTDYTKALTEWLEYGKLKGFGQWRNSGKGRFAWEKVD